MVHTSKVLHTYDFKKWKNPIRIKQDGKNPQTRKETIYIKSLNSLNFNETLDVVLTFCKNIHFGWYIKNPKQRFNKHKKTMGKTATALIHISSMASIILWKVFIKAESDLHSKIADFVYLLMKYLELLMWWNDEVYCVRSTS